MKLAIQAGVASMVLGVIGSTIVLATGDARSAVLGFIGVAIVGLGVLNMRRYGKKYSLFPRPLLSSNPST